MYIYLMTLNILHRLSPLNSLHTIQTLRILQNLCPSKLRTRERWVVKHQSLSHILVKPCLWPSSSAAPEASGYPVLSQYALN